MTPEEARRIYEERYGPVTDEEWAEIAADVEDFEQFLADREAAEGTADAGDSDGGEEDAGSGEGAGGAGVSDEPADEEEASGEEGHDGGETIASLTARVAAMQATLTEQGEVIATMRMTEEERAAREARDHAAGEIAATMFEVDGSQHRFAASAVEVLASLSAAPGPESTAALLEHVKANGGRFCTVPVGQTPGVKPRSSKPPAPKDEVLASWEDDPATHDGIKAIMDADGVASAEAQRRYFAKYNHQ